jgi:hypothetical protein
VRRLAELNSQKAELDVEIEGLKADLRNTLEPGAYEIDGQPAVKVTPSRRFDFQAAYAGLRKADQQECLTVVIDSDKVKQHLTPVELEAFMVEHGNPKVQVL